MVNGNNSDNLEGLKSTIKLVTCFCGYYYYLKGVHPPPLLVSKLGTIPLNLLDQSQNSNYSLSWKLSSGSIALYLYVSAVAC